MQSVLFDGSLFKDSQHLTWGNPEDDRGGFLLSRPIPKKLSSCGRYAMLNRMTGDYWPALCRGRACRRMRCRELYAERTVKLIAGIERLNGFNTMVTLTLDQSKYPDPKDAWRDITRIWHNLCRELQRIYGSFPFVWALEKHPTNDYPHLHISTSQYIPVREEYLSKPGDKHYNPKERVLGELWDSVGGGIITDARFVYGGVATYIGKGFTKEAVKEGVAHYVSKDLLSIGDYVVPHTRVWGSSQGLRRPEKHSNPDVFFMKDMKVFDEELNMILTEEQLHDTIKRETDRLSEYTAQMEKKSDIVYEEGEYDKGQIGEDMAGTCKGGIKEGGQVVASDQREQEQEHGKDQGVAGEAVGSECPDKKTERSIAQDEEDNDYLIFMSFYLGMKGDKNEGRTI